MARIGRPRLSARGAIHRSWSMAVEFSERLTAVHEKFAPGLPFSAFLNALLIGPLAELEAGRRKPPGAQTSCLIGPDSPPRPPVRPSDLQSI